MSSISAEEFDNPRGPYDNAYLPTPYLSQIPSAEEIARRNLARIREEEARRKEIEKRRKELREKAQRQALEKQKRDLSRGGSLPPEMQPGPGFIPSLSDPTMPRTVAPNAKSVNIDGVQKPIDEALADVPKQITLEEQILASPLKARALRRARVEELMRNGRNFQEAEAEAIKEQEKRQTAFDEGRKSIQKETNNPDKEARGFAESIATSVGGPVARIAGYEQAADEIEARNAGIQAELNQYRDENYAYPRVAGAVAGAAQNTAQMGVGVSASILAGPEVGMAVMAGQYGAQEYSRAVYEGKQAGLAGNELHRYALVQGGIEASIMPIMSKIGLGGIESRVLRQSIARGVASHPSMRAALANGAKTLARDTAAEITEEVITEVLHGYATEKLMNQNVDYRRVIEDTVLQTVMMMGMAEGTSRIGGSMGGGTPAGPQVPVNQPAPDVAEESPVQDLALPPEVEAFLANPSRKKYEAAVKAGMPPGADTKTIEGRARYADELRRAREMEAAMQQEQNQPAEPPMEESPGAVPDEDVDMMARMLEEGVPNEEGQQEQLQGQQGVQEQQQGGQEGLLEAPVMKQFLDFWIQGEEASGIMGPGDKTKFRTEFADTLKRNADSSVESGEYVTFGSQDGENSERNKLKLAAVKEYLESQGHKVSDPVYRKDSGTVAMKIEAGQGKPVEPPSTIDGEEAAAVPNDSVPPAATPEMSWQERLYQENIDKAKALTKEEFTQKYLDTYKRMVSYPPDQAGSNILSDEMAAMFDAQPEWADEIEAELPVVDTQTAPAFASGDPSQGQPEPSLAGPASDTEAQSEPELPKGAIGFNSEGIPIFEGKTGIRSIGIDIEQAKSLKKTKDGMKAVLPGPREDRFKTREELEQEKGSPATDSPSPEFLALPQKSQDLFNKAMESKDIPSLKQMVDKSNRVWNKEFERRTGIKLPKTLKDRYQAVIDWANSNAPVGEVILSPDLQLEQKRDEDAAKRKQAISDGGFKVGDRVTQPSTGRTGVLQGISEKSGTVSIKFDNDGSVLSGTDVSGFERIEGTTGKRSEIEKWEVYPTSFQGKPKFAVKEFDSGFGDALFDSEAEAKGYADTGRQRAAEKAEREAKAQAKQEEDQKKQQEYEASFQGFLTDEPMTKGRRLKTLDASINYKGKPTTRKALIEQKVADGWTVNSQDQLQAPTGEFLDKRDLTKTGIDYAQHLVNIGRETETPAESQAEPSQEDLMEQILREELLGETTKPKKERKPRTPKSETAEPKTQRKPRTEAAKKRTERTAAELKAAEDDIRKAFGSTANMGLNPEQMRATARLVRAALNHQVSTFNEFVAYVVDTFGEPMALRMAEGIELAWRTLRRLPDYSGIDEAGTVADVLSSKAKPQEQTGWSAVPGHFAEQLISGKDYKSITEARKEAGEIVGQPIKPGTADAKTLDEAIEHGIVQAGRTIVEEGGTPVQTFDRLVDLYARQPVLGVRDTTSMEMQAYSTPVPLAFLASHLGNVGKDTKVYEPTAGNGMLLIGTSIDNAFANELDPERADILRAQGFDVTTEDAVKKTPPNVQVVLANPPFGKVKDADRKTVEFNVDGFKTTEVDHAIALQAMKGMEPDGHTVLILAAKGHNSKTDLERRQAYSQGKDRPFYDALYQGYDVVQHFTVDGSLYSRQGASFPVDVIVLRPQGTVSADQKRAAPWALMPRKFNNWGEIRNAFFSDMADTSAGTGVRTGASDNGGADLSAGNADDMGRVPGQNENANAVAQGDVRPAESESVVSTPVDGASGSGRGGKKPRGPRGQSGLSGNAEIQRSDRGNVSDAGTQPEAGAGVNAGARSDGMAGTGTAEPGEVDQESHQASYQPSSGNKTVDTLIPTNLQDATRKALEAVEDAHGSIDEFVQKELGYSKNDPFFKDMSAEQVDAIALAIHAHQKGSGMVIGDMTGVGKGRVAAAMMRYANKQGLVPLFVTEKPDLFADIYRDLGDIGSDTAELPFIVITTNDTSGSSSIDLPNGRKIQSSSEANMNMLREGISALGDGKGFIVTIDGKPMKVNAVFTMYSQLQTVKGNETARREQLRALIPNAYLIMDESHNAGGTKKERVNENAPPDRAAYAREIVQGAQGVMYLSATFAKRPDVMDLYSKTDMAKAVDGDITRLGSVVKAGGLPLQQVLSAMLAESGQYIRREKSFEGIEFAKVDVGVNLEEQDKITEVFRTIRSLDAVVTEIVSTMQDDMVAAGESGMAGDVSTGDAGLTSTSFSSILWNAVDQMLFALKADKAADEAIAAWKNGEVPIIAVDNTMESILDEYVKENNLKAGDVVNLSFKDVLHRYLERSRWITVDTGMRTERNKKITRKERLTDDQLNVETDFGNALELFNQASQLIEATAIDAPASPIDWIRYRMQKAGMKISEVTGRKSILVYNENNVATLAARPRSEAGTRGKQETIRKINDGSLDGMILNRSGSTGLSVHASSKVKNQKVRHMMIAQPAKNIDEFMQMLGRVNRTGQVVKPRYSLLMSDSPAELRPAAVLSKKLASLNASVTAKSKGAVGFTVTDVMNEVGGAIVERYLIENPEFARSLDMEREDDEVDEDASRAEILEDIVRKATGRSAILPIVQQREFWEDITAAYNARIEELNALNANPLIAQTMDLDAKTLTSINVFAGTPDEGPFAAPADLERMDIKSPGKPMSPSQVMGRIQEFYEISDINDRFAAQSKWLTKTTESLEAEIGPYREFALSRTVTDEARRGREEMISRQTDSVMEAMSKFTPGTVVRYMVDGVPFDGVVIGFSRRGKTGNPVAPSRWVIEVAINDPAKKLNIPVSQAQNLFTLARAMDQVLGDFERAQTVSRQKRWMGTGNLVAAYAQLSEMNGKLVFYTDDQGQTRRGILMPQSFDANRFLEQRPVQFTNPTEMLRYFDQGGSRLVTADGVLQIVMRNGTLSFVAPRARSRGGKYTLNRGITNAAGRDFITVGNQMSLGVNNRQQQMDTLAAVLEISPLEARLETDREVARGVLNLTKTGKKKYEDDAVVTEQPATPETQPAETVATPNQEALEKARKDLEAQQLLNRQYWQAIVKEWQKVTRGETPATGLPITKEMARNIANALMGSIRAGAKSFEIAIREIRANVSEEVLRDLKQNLIPTWNYFAPKFDLMPATEEAFEAALDATKDQDIEQAAEAAMGAPPATETTPAESQPDEGRLYSTKNAATDMERERFGMEPRVPLPRQSRPEQAETAAAIGKTEAGRKRIDELIAEMSVSPRATSVLENDLLNFRYADLDQKREAALKAKMEARAKDDDAQVAVQDLIASDLLTQQMQLIELLSTTISYALGSGLQARKAWINTDFSMARMMLEYEAAYGERPSKPQQEAMQKLIDELTAAKEALEKKQQELQAENDDLQKRLKEAHDAKTTESAAPAPAATPPATAPTETVVEGLKERGRKRVNAAKKVIADLLKQGFTFSIEGAANEAGKALTELAIGYTEMGIATAVDFLKQLKRDFGPSSEKIKVPALAAFNQVIQSSASAELEIITSKLDITDPDTIGRVARDLHSFVIRRDGLDASEAGRNAAVDAVHEILVDLMPELTKEETARAMSGIGVYSELSKDEAEVVRRDQKAQLLLLEQIADWKKKQAPPVTGPERPPVSDEQRALRRLVNEAKKEAGIVESKAGQLRSALDAAKRMATNRIKDLTKAIEANKRIAGKQKVLKDDGSPEFAELKALQAQRDALQKLYDETFGRPELSDEQRLARAEKALDRAIADLEADLNAGKLYNDNTRAPMNSPALEAKRAQLEALKASREEMRLQSGEAQARSDAAYERHLREKDARLAQRIADNDFAPRPKKPERILTPEATKLMLAVKKKQQEINQKARQWEFDRKHPVYKAIVWGPITTSAIVRKLLTSIDQSLIGRQGYLLGITNPVIYGKSIRKAFPSNPFKALSIFTTEQDLFDVEAELDADTNWVRMEKIGKLAITGVHGGMSREEQNIGVPEWVNRIPGVGGSERAGSAFINTLRRLVFRSLVDKLSKTMDGKGKKISNADLRVIANLVNVSTGRGDINIKGVSQILTASSALFFSPRWWLSRLQWWTGQPIWHNSGWWGEGASTEVRQLVAIEMGKQVMAQGMIIGLVSAALAAAFGAPGDDEEWDFYWNPTHAKFGQMRVSNEYFDMTAGLGAHLSYFARVISGQHNDRWEEKETDKWRLSESYGRGKLAPIPSMYADYLAGSSMGGQKFGSPEWWASKLSPLSGQDVNKAYTKEDAPLATAASFLMFFGVGAQSRDEEMKQRKDAINEVRAAQKQNKPQAEILELMNRHFAEQAAIEAKEELRTAEPEQKEALEKVIAGTESPELSAAIEKEKGDLALIASVMLSSEDRTQGKSANDDKAIETARNLLKTIAPTYDEANAIYTDGYKRRNGSITEIVGSGSNRRFVLKKSVAQARRRLKMLYSE